MFHSRDGLFFSREQVSAESCDVVVTIADYKKGDTRLIDRSGEVVSGHECKQIRLTDTELASVMASMSRRGETAETYQEALAFLRRRPA